MNSWLVFLVEGAAEIMALADSLGVEHQQVLDFLREGNLSNPAAAAKFAKMEAGDDATDLALQWALKDIGLAMDASGRAASGAGRDPRAVDRARRPGSG